MSDNAPTPLVKRAGLAVAHRVLVVLLPVMVLVQAALAGQYLFEASDVITVHGIIGNTTLIVAVAILVLTSVRRMPATAFFVAVALVAMVFAQIGLGYVGRETTMAAAWHIPLGVTIFGTACYQLALVKKD